ncbi:MAG: thiaminase II [Synergistaceae bacterium]|nr:thiaminase II [Synergistaceae bacterium]
MSFSRGLKEKAQRVWEAGYRHPFVQELGRGVLDREKFKFYLLQDYRYLLSYAKVFALGVLKADTEELMSRFSASQDGILNKEMELHREYMRSFGVSREEMASVKPSLYNRAYTANMLATGQEGGVAELLATVFPCAWTYYDYATRLASDYRDGLSENYYKSWIETYSSDEFYESFGWFFDALDGMCVSKSKEELERIEGIFVSSVEFEYLFWEMSYNQQMSYEG